MSRSRWRVYQKQKYFRRDCASTSLLSARGRPAVIISVVSPALVPMEFTSTCLLAINCTLMFVMRNVCLYLHPIHPRQFHFHILSVNLTDTGWFILMVILVNRTNNRRFTLTELLVNMTNIPEFTFTELLVNLTNVCRFIVTELLVNITNFSQSTYSSSK